MYSLTSNVVATVMLELLMISNYIVMIISVSVIGYNYEFLQKYWKYFIVASPLLTLAPVIF